MSQRKSPLWPMPDMIPSTRADTHGDTQEFEFILLDQFSMMSVISAIEPLRAANRLLGHEFYAWKLVSEESNQVCASNGIPVGVSSTLSSSFVPAYTFVCAGLSLLSSNQSRLSAILNERVLAGVKLGSLSMGTIFLARANLLKRTKCTIHWEGLPAFREEFPDMEVSRALYEIDGNRYTCAGGIASLDLFLHLIEQDHGEALVREIANQFQVDRIRVGFLKQRSGSLFQIENAPRKIVSAINIMLANIETPISTQDLSDTIGLSTRTLERLFKNHTGHTPARYYRILRLEHARELLLHSNMNNLEIALATGFHSSNYFSQCYEQHFHVLPSITRQKRRQS